MARPMLIGILIVIPLALLVAAVVIPCIMPAQSLANESSAVACIRTINQAEEDYRATYRGYSDSLTNLGGADPCIKSVVTACLVDNVLASGVKSGYRFMAIGAHPLAGSNTSYLAGAAPQVFGKGERRFCSTEKLVIRVDSNSQHSTTPPASLECAGFLALQ